jgi:uncharacterized protein (TIGR02271 family)
MKTSNITSGNNKAVDKQAEVVPVIEEQLQIEKKEEVQATVTVEKSVNEEEVALNIPYTEEKLTIKRQPVNQFVDDNPPALRQEGDYTIIPVLKEVVVKRTLLVEEVYIHKEILHKVDQSTLNLRTEDVVLSKNHKP